MGGRKTDTDSLWAELKALVRSAPASPAPSRRRARSAATDSRRRARIENALWVRDLAAIRAALPSGPGDAVNRPQRIVIDAFAANLEINSAGLSILFDRFDRRELKRIASALRAIGADRTHTDLIALHDAIARAAPRRAGTDLSEWLQARPETRRIDRKWRGHSAEIDKALLRFCADNLEKLAVA
jgi:hypothetical protein